MSLKQRLFHLGAKLYFERPAQKLPFQDHVAKLRSSGAEVQSRLRSAQPTDQHRQVLRHVIGIERWGQRRIRTFLGEPFVMDAHHPYLPPADTSWDDLVGEFARVRGETVGLAEALSDCNAGGRVPHNQFGEMSARGWLQYLRGHAEVETRRFRSAARDG